MHPETEQLFTTIGEIVKNLNSGGSGIGSEGNHPFHPLVLDTSQQEEFSFTQLLQSSGWLMQIEFDELIEIWQKRFLNPGYSKAQSQNLLSQAMPKYQLLLDILRSQPINLQAYKIQTFTGRVLGFIFGQTNDGDWVGFSQVLPPPDRAAFGKRLPKQDYQPSQAALRLDEQLKPFLPDLNSLIVYQFASTFDMVIESLLRATGLLEIWHFDVFDREQGAGEPYQYENLEKFVASYLNKPRIYVFGNNSLYELYIIGKCQTGDWLGASTLAVWT